LLEEWHAEILMKGKMPGSQKASIGINYITDTVVLSQEMLGFSPVEQQEMEHGSMVTVKANKITSHKLPNRRL
jgi:hypothetical protein